MAQLIKLIKLIKLKFGCSDVKIAFQGILGEK